MISRVEKGDVLGCTPSEEKVICMGIYIAETRTRMDHTEAKGVGCDLIKGGL